MKRIRELQQQMEPHDSLSAVREFGEWGVEGGATGCYWGREGGKDDGRTDRQRAARGRNGPPLSRRLSGSKGVSMSDQGEAMAPTSVPRDWIPMMREAGIAAESLFGGLTALRKANYAQASLYNYAFFGISIGLERMMKLAILVESRARPNGAYPTESEFRNSYKHDLLKLFTRVEEIRAGYSGRLRWDLPNRDVSMVALKILSDFATLTRYYNIDVLVGSSRVAGQRDPVEAWFNEVGGWILQNKYSKRRAKVDEEFVRWSEQTYGGILRETEVFGLISASGVRRGCSSASGRRRTRGRSRGTS
jgi:hypothetical protein